MKPRTIGLVGNPNAGKTTLFNALSGAQQHVGNWPGVTVERKSGELQLGKDRITIIDIPGIYSLTRLGPSAPDEQIACAFILDGEADILINVIDATNLERNLYLTTQLLELNIPIIIALNMMDIAEQRKLKIDIATLEKRLGCPVIPLAAQRDQGITQLKNAIEKIQHQPRQPLQYPAEIEQVLTQLIPTIQTTQPKYHKQARYLALGLLENDRYSQWVMGEHYQIAIEDADLLIADTRYGFAHSIVNSCVQASAQASAQTTTVIDRIVLNRFLGIPLFFGMMYLMFLFAIHIGGIFQDFFDITTNTLFVEGPRYLFSQWQLPDWLIALLASGAGKGINTVATFIPIIGGMFLFLSILEDSGYMARAAFVMDRFMRAVGLPGKSFIPLLIGFGCNVPAIMATRTLENPHDRILTVLMSPYMACGARLTIFAVFGAAFFPHNGQNMIFSLYLIGISMAFLTGLLLRKTLLKTEAMPFIMELPPYHLPTWRVVFRQTWIRLTGFLWQASQLIVPVCMLLGILNTLTPQLTFISNGADQTSLLSALGRFITPLFAPLGIQAKNWPATVALLTGTLAKEVVVATLNTLYTQVGHLTVIADNGFNFWNNLWAAVISIPENFQGLPHALQNPILATAKAQDLNNGVYGIMQQYFSGQSGVFAYLIFTLLYVPCVSTTAVIARELNKRWAIFSVVWSTVFAYGLAVFFYQLATLSQHPGTSLMWCLSIASLFFASIFCLRYVGKNRQHIANLATP